MSQAMKNQLLLYEKSILSQCLNDNLHEVMSDGIKVEMFHDHNHKVIFDAMLKNDHLGNPCDLVNVGSMLLERQDVVRMLADLTDSKMSTQNVSHAIAVLKTAHRRTSILRGMYEIYQAGIQVKPCEQFDIESKLIALLDHDDTSSKNSFTNVGLTLDTLTSIEKDIERGGVIAIKTGIEKLDGHLGGGLKPGRLVTIAARPGCGKTALATNVALNAAMDGFKPHYITIEIDDKEIVERLICTSGRINTNSMAKRVFTDDEMDRLGSSANKIQKMQISVNSTTGGSWEKAEISINLACRYSNANLVVIDYIQQFHTNEKMTAREEINHMTSRCKVLAMKYKVPFLLVAQLNREIEKRGNKTPMMSDLKESGSIEQDSDTVILLYRDENNAFWARIAKNRCGDTGDIPLNADLSINKFYSESPNEWSNRV